MISEDDFKSKLRESTYAQRDNIQKLSQMKEWGFVVGTINESLFKAVNQLKKPSSSNETMRFAQGGVYYIEQIKAYFDKMSNLKDADIELALEEEWKNEVARRAAEEQDDEY